ncbi:preprotein translocase subunit SecE [bacterium]|nr:preprotein translocase subunit SecE [bacterium]
MKFLRKIKPFLKETQVEMKRVTWLSRKQAVRLTLIVIVFSLVMAAFLGFWDFIFSNIIFRFFL